jgi:thiamine transport system substrate-binding protein
VLGLDQNLIVEARQTGLFAPHETPTDDVNVPIEWTDEVFLPYDYGHFAVVYDREAISDPPESLEDLVGGDARQKIVLQDPRTSTPGLGFLLWMKAVYGDEAEAAWERLRPRVLTVTPGWSEAYGLFTQGEVPMVLSYTTSPAYHMIEEDTERYAAAEFEEGHYVQIEVAGRLATSENPDLARQFLAFMTGPRLPGPHPDRQLDVPRRADVAAAAGRLRSAGAAGHHPDAAARGGGGEPAGVDRRMAGGDEPVRAVSFSRGREKGRRR